MDFTCSKSSSRLLTALVELQEERLNNALHAIIIFSLMNDTKHAECSEITSSDDLLPKGLRAL